MLTRDEILNNSDLPIQEVEVPEWGGAVFVRGLSGRERDEYELSMISMRGGNPSLSMFNARAKLVQLGCVDEDGKQLFAKSDVVALGRKNATALDRVYNIIRQLSGLSTEDVKELTSNFMSTLSVDSTSG
jgi:hypothetical protein